MPPLRRDMGKPEERPTRALSPLPIAEVGQASMRLNRSRSNKAQIAYGLVKKAIANGELVRPDVCGNCGNSPLPGEVIYGHHDDYEKPLHVRWCCRRCHGQYHTAYRQNTPQAAEESSLTELPRDLARELRQDIEALIRKAVRGRVKA